MANQKLTIKQRKFIKEYITTGNATEAAMRSYDVKNRETAKVIGYENLTRPHLHREISNLMEENGISEAWLFNCLRAGLNSKITAQYKGKVVETDIPDFNTQHKFLDIILKLKGMYLIKSR